MNKEIDFGLLGIPGSQVQTLEDHLEKAETFVFPEDGGMDDAFLWLKSQLKTLPVDYATVLYDIAQKNKPGSEVSYVEQGYDSNQSHRKLSKVLGETILLGGLIYESNLVGKKIGLEGAKAIVGSTLAVTDGQALLIPEIAEKYGANQDFLFPGVTPSNNQTASLKEFAFKALSGKPLTSVRSLTGVGGVRFDVDWNYATDFTTFVNLKIKEDKRYYPGIGIYFFLLNSDVESDLLVEAIKAVPKKEYQGVSVLCSAYIPSWSEIKQYQYSAGYANIELAESFHSPAYDFASLLDMYKKKDFTAADKFKAKLGNVWSFNSTIHLPWTSALAGLSNDLIGRVTNGAGDWAIRYGVGWNGKSLEVREYHFGLERKFPAGVGGKTAYTMLFYPHSDVFEGKPVIEELSQKSSFWVELKKHGFMVAALARIEEEKK